MSRVTLLVSVSGGRTSAYMAWWLLNNREEVKSRLEADSVKFVHVFANTGMEHDDTLRFLNDLDKNLGLDLVWIEARPYHGERKGCEPYVTTYERAYRWHQWRDEDHPFHAHCKKYGVPNMAFPTCSSTMKRDVIERYMRQRLGLSLGEYASAIGIRADEKRRVTKSSAKGRWVVYPLAEWTPTDNEDVLEFWAQYDWDLRVPLHMGNCITCWKKSFNKLASVARRLPLAFDFCEEMESRYGLVRAKRTKSGNPDPLTFWRNRHSTAYIRHLASLSSEETDGKRSRDEVNSCSESCEFLETEMIQHDLFEEFE